ncbi:MAG: thermonuclease family protein [Actinobacteria bacterium]|nr:thermonuclease family protein [Actinomycetota bacterium]
MSISILMAAGCGLFYDFDPAESQAETDIRKGPMIDENKEQEDITSGEGYEGSSTAEDPYNDPRYTVTEVIDGDTIILSSGDRIRLIGINTPEEEMYFYGEARDVLEMMIIGKEVRLEKDISESDQYGRKLRYVYCGEIFVNLEMVKRGFANIFTYPPDVKYSEIFLEAERYARENDLGLWEISKTGMVSVEIFYDAPGNDNENINGEYIVLENTGSMILNTSGWTVKDSGTNIYPFGGYKFNPDTRIILFSGEGMDGGKNGTERYLYWNSPRPVWNNDHDTLYLRDSEGLLIEIYDY